MAQKLAHEIKTPLSSVMLAAQQLQNMSESPKSAEYLKYIIDQVYRLRNTTDAFMKFAHLSPPNLQPTNINQILENCLQELAAIIPTTIQIKTEFQSDLPNIFVDQDEIIIAFKNIFENALHAMKDQGILTINTRLVQLLQTGQEGVTIEISDTGCGIPTDELDKIFEPFFSHSESGTGLGLTLVKKIINEHQGEIEIRSNMGIGTTVIITLI